MSGSCVTITSVDPRSRFSSNIRSITAFAGARIEAAGRFVGQQQGRMQDEGAGQRDPLLLAAAEVLRIVRQPLAESHALQQFTRGLDRVAALGHAPAEFERQQDVLERVQVRQQLERLEHESEALRPQRRASVLVAREQVLAEQADRAARGNVESREQSQQGRLARSPTRRRSPPSRRAR